MIDRLCIVKELSSNKTGLNIHLVKKQEKAIKNRHTENTK